MELTAVPLVFPADCNVVVGQSHFIKTAEDIAEIVITTVPQARFGLAFCEASGPCLIRTEGNDPALGQDGFNQLRRNRGLLNSRGHLVIE